MSPKGVIFTKLVTPKWHCNTPAIRSADDDQLLKPNRLLERASYHWLLCVFRKRLPPPVHILMTRALPLLHCSPNYKSDPASLTTASKISERNHKINFEQSMSEADKIRLTHLQKSNSFLI